MNRAQEQKLQISDRDRRGDWRWQIEHATRRLDDLDPALLPRTSRRALRAAAQRFPLSVTPYYLSLIDPSDPDDPLLRMVLPSSLELVQADGVSDDPIAEQAHSPLPGLIRRYPDRALLLVAGSCPAVCRHCTRRILGRGRVVALDEARLREALAYLRERPEIRDVIVSGGEPLTLEDDALDRILGALRAIPSVEVIRVATRAPATLPMRVTDRLAATLARHGAVYVVTQFNHPREITTEAATALARLADAGLSLANQSVLLRGVNDSPAIVERLCRALLRSRVRPYYLFMCDLVAGTAHFRTPLATGIAIVDHLRGRLSGLAIPQLVVDLPGGAGKVPIGPSHVVRREGDQLILRAPDGGEVPYPDPPQGFT